MRQSHLFTKTRKEAPADEVAKNAQLLIRAGYVHKHMAGAYEFLPLGLRVMNNISNIVRAEMDAIGGQELKMTVLQDADSWKKSDRWSDEKVDNWFKTDLKNGSELGLGFTHEEPLTVLMKEYVHSYRDLPIYPYQIQAKFRNEARAKSGIMRGREFLMKDLYSFSRTQEEHDAFYEKIQKAYMNIFEVLDIGDITFLTVAGGGSFIDDFSHEFQTITDAGEDIIYLDRSKNLALNKEVYTDEVIAKFNLDKNNLEEIKASEVGNIYTYGVRYSEPLELYFEDENGERKPVLLGAYGIGIGRLMGVIAEIFSDEKGLVWPESVAPFKVHVLLLGEDRQVTEAAEKLYTDLQNAGIEVLFDDRAGFQPGEKFNDADLLGIPYRIVVSEKSLAAGGVEIKKRTETEGKLLSPDEALAILK